MRTPIVVLCVFLAVACDRRAPETAQDPPPAPAAPPQQPATDAAAASPPAAEDLRPVFPLRVDGTRFLDAASRPFEWRGITAFRLAEMIAGGREADAAAYLDWAASEHLTVVRVLLMAKHLFELAPDRGRSALPRLLDLAKARGLAVEVVALADTKEYTFDFDTHIGEIGRVALEKGNAFVEIANEPGHPTQDARVHDPATLKRLAGLIPEPVVVALGSIEYGEGFRDGDYVTTHVARGEEPWDHVLNIAKHASVSGKPLVSDEPIGAAPRHEPGRRDNDPARFAAAAALTRLSGMEATFHYEGGLEAKIPESREAACLAAWQTGLLLVGEPKVEGTFVQGSAIDRIARVSGARATFARVGEGSATLLLLDPQTPEVQWGDGWSEARRSGVPGLLLISAVRAAQ